jgi:predicted DNA-binding protein with PD1-like motif
VYCKKINNKYILRIDKGEEIIETIKKVCTDNNISLGVVSGIGAVNRVVIGLFETGTKEYHSVELTGDHEISSLVGNISTLNGGVYLHIHINLSDAEYRVRGGHLTSAVVSATSEIIIESIDGEIERQYSDEIGLNLIKG